MHYFSWPPIVVDIEAVFKESDWIGVNKNFQKAEDDGILAIFYLFIRI